MYGRAMGEDRDWDDAEHARSYLIERQELPHRIEGEAVVVESLGPNVSRVLDLGAGDGRVLACVLDAHPGAEGVALDHNAVMLEASTARFGPGGRVSVVEHDLTAPLPTTLGRFDAVVSGLALHHFVEERRRELLGEIANVLEPGGVFADLDLVRSSSEARNQEFMERARWEISPDRPWDRNPNLDQRLSWVEQAGFINVDCLWKWRELALIVGETPS